MKTAEQAASEIVKATNFPLNLSELVKMVEAIQADARHAALTEAASVAYEHGADGVRFAILALRDKEKGQDK